MENNNTLPDLIDFLFLSVWSCDFFVLSTDVRLISTGTGSGCDFLFSLALLPSVFLVVDLHLPVS